MTYCSKDWKSFLDSFKVNIPQAQAVGTDEFPDNSNDSLVLYPKLRGPRFFGKLGF